MTKKNKILENFEQTIESVIRINKNNKREIGSNLKFRNSSYILFL